MSSARIARGLVMRALNARLPGCGGRPRRQRTPSRRRDDVELGPARVQPLDLGAGGLERGVEPGHLERALLEQRRIRQRGLELDPAVRGAIFEIGRENETLPRVVEGRWRDAQGFFLIHLVHRRRGEERSLAAQSDWIRLRIMMERRVTAEREQVAALAHDRDVRTVALSRVLRFEPDSDAGCGDAGCGDASASPSADR